MRTTRLLAAIVVILAPVEGQAIIAQSSGLVNPEHVIDFGANLFPNFTPVSTQFPGITITHARYFTTGSANNLMGGFLTNDPIGSPDTLRIAFSSPIHDLTFVYHQIGTSQPSVFRAVLAGATVTSFSNLSNQSQSNNYFGFTNVVFDELQLDFVSDFNVDTLAFNGTATCTTRNGIGINPLDYACLTLPIIGTTWTCTINTTVNTIATVLAIAPGGPSPGTPLLNGELLIQLSPAPLLFPGPVVSIPIPYAPALVGLSAATQAARVEAVGPTQTIVLLNAIDLVLGP